MGKITFILGGARSGKSTYAINLAKKNKRVAFLATCQAFDREMAKRIKIHKSSRPDHWETFEEPCDIEKILAKIGNKFDLIVIDCLTLWVSNLMIKKLSHEKILKKTETALNSIARINARVIIVSNEVGLGIVPNNKLARDFRDIAGKVNQIIASKSDKVFFMVAGIPMMIKK
ncbi:bifunctional adenosylcobinamide kinase/adenosylcobinamide-phosphate guanylyltransferase [bacterium]|nr:MAG: bifunctional adenosylcobinamide kinase/adenosylcobinamide-phosphate guanylyltransferase [bacterium]